MPTRPHMRPVAEPAREAETLRYAAYLVDAAIKNDTGKPLAADQLRTSSDANLTALAQLGALRTSTARALISVFDESYQYIVAEATTSVQLAPNLAQSDHGADIRLCGTAIPRSQGACDYTVCGDDPDGYAEPALHPAELPVTRIDDLTTSPRFSVKPYCLPGGLAQFHAAVPIRTKRGVNIGVFCVMHPVPRPAWSDADSQVLRQISSIIMDHFEAKRDRNHHRRAERMNRGLDSFLENQATLVGWENGAFPAAYTDEPHMEGSLNKLQQDAEQPPGALQPRAKTHPEQETAQQRPPLPPHQFPSQADEASSQPEAALSANAEPAAGRPPWERTARSLRDWAVDEQDPVGVIFGKAANIIRESVETEGCLFVDPSTSTFGAFSANPGNVSSNSRTSASSSSGSGEESREENNGTSSSEFCSVLGFSNSRQHSINGDSDSSFRGQVTQKLVAVLLQRYPRGRVFNFDSNGDLLSSDSSDGNRTAHSGGDSASPLSPSARRRKPSRAKSWSRGREASNLLQIFPRARSVVFLPIWNAKKEQWHAAGFIYTQQASRCFTEDVELSFLRVFGMMTMNTVLRHATLKADKAKSDALSSISHELRSPMHGVLLSVELLNDTPMTVFQRNVSHTIETCSRTLTDTLDHLLDYSKINQFDTAPGNSKNQTRPRWLRQGAFNTTGAGLMSLESVVNLSSLAEEVVESVFAGFYFQQMSVRQLVQRKQHEFADNAGNSRLDGIRALEDLSFDTSKPLETAAGLGNVSVFLMIDAQHSWTFLTEAGALRRIIMNLFANSLKYTRRGVIKVSLTQSAIKASRPKSKRTNNVVLSVSDTGVGMTQSYLDNHLFKPFSQEDSLSPGTGLGLSIVKKIVSQQKGRIAVRSRPDVGTTVTVSLPLRHEPPATNANHLSSARSKEFMGNIQALQGLRVCLVGMAPAASVDEPVDIDGQTLDSLSALRHICNEWLNLEVVLESDLDNIKPDLVIVSSDKLEEHSRNKQMKDFPTVVLCRDAISAYNHTVNHASLNTQIETIEFISQPIGPQKLSKILALALHRWENMQIRSESAPSDTEGNSSEQDHSASPATPDTQGLSTESLHDPDRLSQPVAAQQETERHLTPIDERSSHARKQSPLTMPYLLVDDNAINLKILCTFMTKLKKKFRSATNGREALDEYKSASKHCKCIFMDISMPVMDGLEATRAIRAYERESKLPPVLVIALTGLASSETQQEAFTSGVDLFLTKPVKLAELSAILKSRGLINT